MSYVDLHPLIVRCWYDSPHTPGLLEEPHQGGRPDHIVKSRIPARAGVPG